MTISKDRVKPSPKPDSWKLNEIFATGIVIGTYLALVTVLFYWVIIESEFFEVLRTIFFYYLQRKFSILLLLTDVFTFHFVFMVQTHFHVRSLSSNTEEISSAIYLQVSIISQALIFVTRSQGWSFMERPGTLLMCAFVVAQLVGFSYLTFTSSFFNQVGYRDFYYRFDSYFRTASKLYIYFLSVIKIIFFS